MAKIAAVLFGERAPSLDAGGVGGVGDRLRRRQFGNDIGALLQIGVAQSLGHFVHRLADA